VSGAIGAIGSLAIPAISTLHSTGRTMSFPVRPAYTLYANFKHIQVFPDSSLEGGIPLYKLTVLDTLLDRLSRGPSAAAEAATPKQTRITAENIDGAIAALAGRLKGPAAGTLSFSAGLMPHTGLIVDMVA
jgi:hypothetical protein